MSSSSLSPFDRTLSGGIRALEVAEEVEQAIGKPVITSNQAQFWSCLRRAGITDELKGFGQIFSKPGEALLPQASRTQDLANAAPRQAGAIGVCQGSIPPDECSPCFLARHFGNRSIALWSNGGEAGQEEVVEEVLVGTDDVSLSALRRDFHRFPELGFRESRTKARVAKFLREHGLEVHEGVGVVGILRSGKCNRAIGLRADMDALPILEASRHEHASETPGIMHACGHDGHMTMLLGAARTLAESPGFSGTVVFIFQPNEEHGLGARAMIKEGVLERFPIEEIYAIHNLPGAPVGQVSTRPGLICSSESLFEITIRGQGGHASMPQVGRDSITVGAELVLALQTIVSRKLPPGTGAVVSVTEFLTDGQRNVLPGTVTLKGDVRSRSPEDRSSVEIFMRQIADGVASAHGVSVNVDFSTEFIETINAAGPTEAVLRAARSAGLDSMPDRQPMSFSEDFAHFAAAVPGCFLLLGNGEVGAHGQPLHSSEYDFNDEVLPIGVAFWTALVRDRLPVQQEDDK